jgi:hypothetical protein
MNEVVSSLVPALPAMASDAVENVRLFESQLMKCPQMDLKTVHVIHAGLYSRTVKVPANHVIVGVLVKIPTQVIVYGKAKVLIGDKILNLSGYHVLPAQAGRKQIFIAITDIYITMMFSTSARTVQEAEGEFTDETDILMSRRDESENIFIKTEN